MMSRRALLGATVAAVAFAPLVARTQQPMPVIGWLSGRPPDAEHDQLATFRRGLREAGFVEGHDLTIEFRHANADYGRLPALAAELVRRRVSAIVAVGGDGPVQAAKSASPTIPIIATFAQDPVHTGVAASLARPGGNVTGVSLLAGDLQGKSLDLLYELIPSLASVAVIFNPDLANIDRAVRSVREAARTLGLHVEFFAVPKGANLDAIFDRVIEGGHGALLVTGGLGLLPPQGRLRLVALAARHRLPAIYFGSLFKDFGALLSYGPDTEDIYRTLALLTARILKGVDPAELPIEQPTKFNLAVNLKTAQALGITIPPSILARADEVIE